MILLNSMKLIEIAAIGQNHELGDGKDMIWHLPEDLKFFRKTTLHSPIVMGRKTFESLPKALPKRINIVVSKTRSDFPEGVEVYPDLDAFFKAWKDYPGDVFVIGGGLLYKELLPYASELILTRVDASSKKATVFFPEFDEKDFIKTILQKGIDNGISCTWIQYKRIHKPKTYQ